jgi:hypothetical protein
MAFPVGMSVHEVHLTGKGERERVQRVNNHVLFTPRASLVKKTFSARVIDNYYYDYWDYDKSDSEKVSIVTVTAPPGQ